jgi:AraC-like DNA-binding protein
MKKCEFTYSEVTIQLNQTFPIEIFDWKVSCDQIDLLHHHNCLEIGICYAGYGIYLIDGKLQSYQAGDIVILGSNVYHRAHTESKDSDLWSFISFHPKDWGKTIISNNIKLIIPKKSNLILYEMLNQLKEEYQNNLVDKEVILKGLMSAIIPYIKREYDKPIISLERDSESNKLTYIDERIQKALNILMNDYSKTDLSISKLAERCNTSVSNFRSLFKRMTGISPKQFQIELKLKKAMSLVQFSDFRMIDIAYECGFNTISSFNRQFYKRYGITPTQIRKNQ